MTCTYYTIIDIHYDRKNAKYHDITEPGWYAFDGPEGDELISGPFECRAIAEREATHWTE